MMVIIGKGREGKRSHRGVGERWKNLVPVQSHLILVDPILRVLLLLKCLKRRRGEVLEGHRLQLHGLVQGKVNQLTRIIKEGEREPQQHQDHRSHHPTELERGEVGAGKIRVVVLQFLSPPPHRPGLLLVVRTYGPVLFVQQHFVSKLACQDTKKFIDRYKNNMISGVHNVVKPLRDLMQKETTYFESTGKGTIMYALGKN